MSEKNVRKKHARNLPFPGPIDYAKLPKEVERIMAPEPDVTEDIASISSDGVQFLARFPQDIARAIGIKKGDLLKFRVVRHSPKLKKETEVMIEYVRGKE